MFNDERTSVNLFDIQKCLPSDGAIGSETSYFVGNNWERTK